MSVDNDLDRFYETSSLPVNLFFTEINPRSRILGDVWANKINPESRRRALDMTPKELEILKSKIKIVQEAADKPWSIKLRH